MEYLTLKNSDLTVSRICMGGCPMGGYGWGDVQDRELIDAVHTALDKGITIFDNADTYGLGHSEEVLGKALGGHRKDVVVATKFGVRVTKQGTIYDNTPDYIHEALTASLRRIGTDYIDLYQVHYRDKTPIEDVIDALEEEKQKGRIRYYGLSNIHENDLDELRPFKGRFVSFQEEYSLATRKNESDIKKIAEELNVNLLTWGSLGQGILTGKYNKDNVQFGTNDRRSREIYVNFHGDKLLKNLKLVEEMKKIAAYYDKPLAALAERFILDYIPDSVVLVGAKRPSQIEDLVKGADWKLETEDLNTLDELSAG